MEFLFLSDSRSLNFSSFTLFASQYSLRLNCQIKVPAAGMLACTDAPAPSKKLREPFGLTAKLLKKSFLSIVVIFRDWLMDIIRDEPKLNRASDAKEKEVCCSCVLKYNYQLYKCS